MLKLTRRLFLALLGSTALTPHIALANPIRAGVLTARAYGQRIVTDFMGGSLGDATYTNENTETYRDSSAVLQQAAANAGRFDHHWDATALGLILEMTARDNQVTAGDVSDLNPATSNWTVDAGGFTFGTTTGPDGVADSATTIEATANNSIVRLNLGSLGSAQRTASAIKKRMTGAGAVGWSMDDGSTELDVSGQIAGGAWTTVDKTQTLDTTVLEIRLGTSGDKIAVFGVNAIEAAYPESTILTGGATKAANTISCPVVAGQWAYQPSALPAAMVADESVHLRKFVFTNINKSVDPATADVEWFYTLPGSNTEASVLLTGESLTDLSAYSTQAVRWTGIAGDGMDYDGGAATANKFALLSYWFKSSSALRQRIFNSGGVASRVFHDSGTILDIEFYHSSGAAYDLTVASVIAADGTWHHVLFSVDVSDTGSDFLYVNDALQSISPVQADFNIEWDALDATIDFGVNGTGDPFNGDIADFYLTNEYLDISVEANRRKFIDASGAPVDLGADGSTPTGTAPLFFQKGPASSFPTNLGSAGDWTDKGNIADGDVVTTAGA